MRLDAVSRAIVVRSLGLFVWKRGRVWAPAWAVQKPSMMKAVACMEASNGRWHPDARCDGWWVNSVTQSSFGGRLETRNSSTARKRFCKCKTSIHIQGRCGLKICGNELLTPLLPSLASSSAGSFFLSTANIHAKHRVLFHRDCPNKTKLDQLRTQPNHPPTTSQPKTNPPQLLPRHSQAQHSQPQPAWLSGTSTWRNSPG